MMRTMLCVLALFALVAATPHGRVSRTPKYPRTLPDGTVVYRFGDAWPVIYCPVNDTCEAEFGSDEVVKGRPILGDPSGAWQAESTRGPYAILAIHPLQVGRFTDVTVLMINTNEDVGRVYHLFVRSVPASDSVERIFVRWTYPPTPPPKVVYVPGPVRTPEPTPTPLSPLNGVDFNGMNCSAYAIRGEAPFKPTRVCTDGTFVFVQMPPHASLPAIAAFDNGPEHVNWTFDQNCYKVVGQASHYVLVRTVNGKRQQVELVRQ